MNELHQFEREIGQLVELAHVNPLAIPVSALKKKTRKKQRELQLEAIEFNSPSPLVVARGAEQWVKNKELRQLRKMARNRRMDSAPSLPGSEDEEEKELAALNAAVELGLEGIIDTTDFMRQSVAKKMLRTAREDGVKKIHRGKMSAYVPDTWAIRAARKNAKKHNIDIDAVIPPPGVNVARKGTPEYERVPIDRRHMAAHEIGHSRDGGKPAVDAIKKANRYSRSGDQVGGERFILDEERAANAEAIRRLRAAGANDEEIRKFRYDARKGVATYKERAAMRLLAKERKNEALKALLGRGNGSFKERTDKVVDIATRPATIAERRKILSNKKAGIGGKGVNEHTSSKEGVPKYRMPTPEEYLAGGLVVGGSALAYKNANQKKKEKEYLASRNMGHYPVTTDFGKGGPLVIGKGGAKKVKAGIRSSWNAGRIDRERRKLKQGDDMLKQTNRKLREKEMKHREARAQTEAGSFKQEYHSAALKGLERQRKNIAAEREANSKWRNQNIDDIAGRQGGAEAADTFAGRASRKVAANAERIVGGTLAVAGGAHLVNGQVRQKRERDSYLADLKRRQAQDFSVPIEFASGRRHLVEKAGQKVRRYGELLTGKNLKPMKKFADEIAGDPWANVHPNKVEKYDRFAEHERRKAAAASGFDPRNGDAKIPGEFKIKPPRKFNRAEQEYMDRISHGMGPTALKEEQARRARELRDETRKVWIARGATAKGVLTAGGVVAIASKDKDEKKKRRNRAS